MKNMKNTKDKKLIQAYDAYAPDEAAKSRMLQAALEKANAEKSRKPIFLLLPKKARVIATFVAAVTVIFVGVWSWQLTMDNGQLTVNGSSSEEEWAFDFDDDESDSLYHADRVWGEAADSENDSGNGALAVASSERECECCQDGLLARFALIQSTGVQDFCIECGLFRLVCTQCNYCYDCGY